MKVDEKSDIWKLPDLIEKILISGIPSEGVQAKRAKAMLNHLKPIMRECKIKVLLSSLNWKVNLHTFMLATGKTTNCENCVQSFDAA